MVAVVFGIQGVGKSSLIKAVIEQNKGFERLYWGKYVLEIALAEKLVEGIDQIRDLPIKIQKSLQRRVGDKFIEIIKKHPNKNYIIETHAALKTQEGFMAGFTTEILEGIKPEVFFVIEAHAIDIYHRRILDETRRRDHDKTVREIQLNLDATKWYATTFCVLTGANLMIVENVEDNLDVAVMKVSEVLQRYCE